jgi:1,4-alpha-glucan branching enzyme
MGGEFGQWKEWWHEESLEWRTLQYPFQRGLQNWMKDLNRLYRSEPALHEVDFSREGFEWVDFRDWESSVISFLRRGKSTGDILLVAGNFTPVPRLNYRIGVPRGGYWMEVLNSDAAVYQGSNWGNAGGVEAAPTPSHGKYHSLCLSLPPLGILFFKNSGS